jgi:hypothetical protein
MPSSCYAVQFQVPHSDSILIVNGHFSDLRANLLITEVYKETPNWKMNVYQP